MLNNEEKVDGDVGVTAHADYPDEDATKEAQDTNAKIEDEEEEEEYPCCRWPQRCDFESKLSGIHAIYADMQYTRVSNSTPAMDLQAQIICSHGKHRTV